MTRRIWIVTTVKIVKEEKVKRAKRDKNRVFTGMSILARIDWIG